MLTINDLDTIRLHAQRLVAEGYTNDSAVKKSKTMLLYGKRYAIKKRKQRDKEAK